MRASTPGILALIGLVGGLLFVVGFEVGQGRPGGVERGGDLVLSAPPVGRLEKGTLDANRRSVSSSFLSVPTGRGAVPTPDRVGHEGSSSKTTVLRRARLEGRLHGLAPSHEANLTIVSGPDAGRQLPVSGDGTFSSPALSAGSTVVRIDAGGVPFARTLDLVHGRTARLELDLGQRPLLRGRVVDARGHAVGGAQVLVDGQSVFSDPEGHFAATCAASGRVTLRVLEEGHVPVELDGVDPGCELEVRLEPAGQLEVVVENWTPGLELEVSRRTRTSRGNRTTLHRHRHVLRGPHEILDELPADWIQLRLFDADGLRATKTIRILSGRTATVRLRS